MKVTAEQIQQAMAAFGGQEETLSNPVITAIEVATQTSTVRNVVKVQGGELRCIVTSNGVIKPTTISEGGSTQEYNTEDEDVIAWISMINGERQILTQDKHGINPISPEALSPIFGERTGYALSYLGSFGGDNNILLDAAKVANYESAELYAESIMGASHNELRTLLTSRCTNAPNYKETCQTWDEAEVYVIDNENPRTITWGARAMTTNQYVSFSNVYVLIWIKPSLHDAEGNQVFDDIMQVVTRQIHPDSVPQLGPDSNAIFEVEETINDQVQAYAIVTEDTMTGILASIKLFKTADFDVNKASF